MFTVNIKGKRDPKNINFVKLEMVFYKRGYTRVTKVINIKGLYSDWDQKSQLFVGKESSERISFSSNRNLNTSKLASAGMPKVRIGFPWSYLTIMILIQTTETNIFQSRMLLKNWRRNSIIRNDIKIVVYLKAYLHHESIAI